MPIPFILGALLVGGGFLGGALSRQPEINKLKKQVKTLQAEIVKLQLVIKEQDRQINELKIRYNTLKAYQFTEKAKQKSKVKGALMFQYCFKEYVELLVAQTKSTGYTMKEEEGIFFNIFEKLMNNEEIDVEAKMYLREYIHYKYSDRINSLQEVNMDNLVEKVELANVA